MGGGEGEPGHGSLRRSTINAVAGAVAGGVARTVVSPLDVIKIRFQVCFFCSRGFFLTHLRICIFLG
jgi:hypothetical protein